MPMTLWCGWQGPNAVHHTLWQMVLVVFLNVMVGCPFCLGGIVCTVCRCWYACVCLSAYQSTKNSIWSCWLSCWCPWCLLALLNSIMIMDANFLVMGTTIAGSIVYLSLIAFLRMLLWSSRKLGSGFFFISLTLPLQNLSHYCAFFSTSKLSFPTL